MNLKPELLAALTELGVTSTELDLLRERMLSAVTSLAAQLTALDAQISTLTAQRNEVQMKLSGALVTVEKLTASGQ